MAKTDHTQWAKKTYTLGRLHPDLVNPRLIRPANSDLDAFHMLAEDDDTVRLAKAISVGGYMPVDDLVVIKEEAKLVVVEGNRRLTAYKLIKDPSLAPKRQQKKFQKLHTDYSRSLPGKYHAVLAPSRIEANVWVYQKHTPNTFSKKWDKVQQAFFIARLLENHATVKEALEQESQITRADAKAAKLTVTLFHMIPSLDLTEAAKKDLSSPVNFPYSAVVERLLERPFAAELLGIRASAKHGVELSISEGEAVRILSRIFSDATKPDPEDATGKKMILDTRTMGTQKQQRKYMGSLNAPTTRSPWKSGEGLANTPAAPEPGKPKPKPPPPPPKKGYGNKLFAVKFDYTGKHCKRLPDILRELQTHKPVKEHLNSSCLLLRTALELLLVAWLKRNNRWNRTVQSANNKKIGPMMSEMVGVVKQCYKTDLGLDPQEANAVKLALDDVSMDTLNAWVHNTHYPADEQTLKALCTKLTPLFQALIRNAE